MERKEGPRRRTRERVLSTDHALTRTFDETMAPRKDIVIGDPGSDDDFISDGDDLYDDDGKGKKGKGKASDKKRDKGKGKATEVRLDSPEYRRAFLSLR